MALRACIDAGTQKGVFSVAAVAFGHDRAVKANGEWKRLMKGRTFHMTDLNARQGDFAGIGKDEVDEIMRGTVGIISKYASFIIAVSCDAQLVADALPVMALKHPDMEALLSAVRSTYGLMCHFAMTAMGSRANNGGLGRQISYVFEKGDEGQRGLKTYLEFLGEGPHHQLLLNGYSFNRLTIADKEGIEGVLHASDLLAWEWARHVDRHKRGLPARRSLIELVGGFEPYEAENGLTIRNDPRVYCRHFRPERLTAVLGFFRESLLASTHDETDAAFARYRQAYPGPGKEAAIERLAQFNE
jgi:hypothetical protein